MKSTLVFKVVPRLNKEVKKNFSKVDFTHNNDILIFKKALLCSGLEERKWILTSSDLVRMTYCIYRTESLFLK
jgi:hypothetical protein